MEKYSFFDSIEGTDEREYTADEFADYFRQVISTGILNGGENLQVICEGTNMSFQIKQGYAWLEGYLYKIESEPLAIKLDTADPTLNRIDRVIIRLDKRLEHRYIKAFVLKGVPGQSPSAVELTRNDNVFEIALAQINVLAGKSFVEQSQITDERLNSEVCGMANSLVTADTTEIFNQFNDWFKEKTNDENGEFYTEWKAWFDKVKDSSYMTQSQADEKYVNQEEFNELETDLKAEIDVFRKSNETTGTIIELVVNVPFDFSIDGNIIHITPNITNQGSIGININNYGRKVIKKFDLDSDSYVVLEDEDIKKNTPISLTWNLKNDFFVYAPKGGAGKNFEKLGYKKPFVIPISDASNFGLNSDQYIHMSGVNMHTTLNGGSLLACGVQVNESLAGVVRFDISTGNRYFQQFHNISYQMDFCTGNFDNGNFALGSYDGDLLFISTTGGTKAKAISHSSKGKFFKNGACILNDWLYISSSSFSQMLKMKQTDNMPVLIDGVSGCSSGIICTDGTYVYIANYTGLKKYSQNPTTGDITLIGSFTDSTFSNRTFKDIAVDEYGNVFVLMTYNAGGQNHYVVYGYSKFGNTFKLAKQLGGAGMIYFSRDNASVKVENGKLYIGYRPYYRPIIGSSHRTSLHTNRIECHESYVGGKKLWTVDAIGGGGSSEYMPFCVKNGIIPTANTPYSPDYNGGGNYVYPNASIITEGVIPFNKLKDKLK